MCHDIFLILKFIYLFQPHCEACGILVHQTGITVVPSAIRTWNLRHWPTREFPCNYILKCLVYPVI